jgi:hypothetical protein
VNFFCCTIEIVVRLLLESEEDEVMLVIVKIQQSHKPLRDVSVLGKHKFM